MTTPIEVRSPYDGEVLAALPAASGDDARRAVDAADAALRTPLAPDERAAVLHDLSRRLLADAELPSILAREAGKPIALARAEVGRAATTARIAAGEAERLAGTMVPLGATPGTGHHLAFTRRVPVGVVGAITPFNFPVNLVMHKLAPAIAAGCPVVLKPADKTPLSALRLQEHAVAAGLPSERLHVLVGPPEPIAAVFCEDPRVALITFTGSAAIGLALQRRAAGKRVTLELGNATPAVVCADADVAGAAAALATGAFGFAGQACISVQRVYVERPVLEALTDALAARAGALRLGDPLDEATDVGPVISDDARARILGLVDDAVHHRARVVSGGTHDGRVIAPTVLRDAEPAARIEREEAFGPVVSVVPVDSADEGIERANATPYGLQAGIFTRDLERALHASHRLDFAAVTINESPSFRADGMPYGGIKESGNTREGPAWAIREMTEERLTLIAGAQPA